MEPVTHILTGACLARSGLNRRAAYTTAAMAIAAEFPDIDTLWGIRGPISGFQHHRGITHTFLGLPFEAALLLAGFWVYERRRARKPRNQSKAGKNATQRAPVRWATLYGFILLALLSHILLDFTNNYGVRPFFPFNTHWYAASIVFIFDPLLFLFLLAGLLLPGFFGLVGQEVGARRPAFRGAGWARAALAGVVLLWGVRSYEHGLAASVANAQIFEVPAPESAAGDPEPGASRGKTPDRPETLTPQKIVVSPDPLNVFRWYTATDFGPAYQLGTVNTRIGTLSAAETLNKPTPNLFLKDAEQSRLGRVYLDWSSMPWLSADDPKFSDPAAPDPEITVLFQDLRYKGTTPLLPRGNSTPLTGIVVLSRASEVLEQGMDGRFER